MARIPEATQLADRVEALVKEVESGTSAELIVVVAGRSSTYRWVTAWVAVGFGLAAAAFFCWSPWVFDDRWIPIDVLVVAAAAAVLVATNERLRVWLAGGTEPAAAVRLAADAAFWQEAVHATRGRTGVLVYVSVLERRVILHADSGIVAAVPGAEWVPAVAAVEGAGVAPEPFAVAFRALGRVLSAHLPREHDDVNESPDEPRVRV
ncbi:MAG: hypothetical protein EXR69_09990 [Myxococcales bacterium]|nr:hypothetical protein [Myxococcales bacterium]